jgi:hypothetical protein
MIASLTLHAALLGVLLPVQVRRAEGWQALPLPSLCRPSPAAPHVPALLDGDHLLLAPAAGRDGRSEPPLAVPELLDMLERGARGRCSRAATPTRSPP